jgi:acetylornithine deacetylase/succinyl-diaminopimelate desuccinylase-like protein
VVNCRIMPGDTIQGVMAFVEGAIADPRVKITPLPVEPQSALRKAGVLVKAGASPKKGKASAAEGSLRMAVRPGEATRVNGWEPSEVSEVSGDEYRLLEKTIRQVFVNTVAVPSVMMWATDARHYSEICRQVLRFTPIVLVPDDLGRQHGINERLSLENRVHMVHFYRQWIQNHGEGL